MTSTSQDIFERRVFLAAAASGMATLAGCSTGDASNDNTQTENPSPTEGPETGSDSGSPSQNGSVQGEDQRTVTSTGERVYEEEYKQNLSRQGMMWIDIHDLANNLNIPDSPAENIEEIPDGRAGTHGRLVDEVRKKFETEGEINTVVFGFSDARPSEGIENGPYRGINVAYDLKGRDLGQMRTPGGGAYTSDAVEEFLDKNVRGVSDHSDNIDSELLEYAQQ